jgi:hypothetical protein
MTLLLSELAAWPFRAVDPSVCPPTRAVNANAAEVLWVTARSVWPENRQVMRLAFGFPSFCLQNDLTESERIHRV